MPALPAVGAAGLLAGTGLTVAADAWCIRTDDLGLLGLLGLTDCWTRLPVLEGPVPTLVHVFLSPRHHQPIRPTVVPSLFCERPRCRRLLPFPRFPERGPKVRPSPSIITPSLPRPPQAFSLLLLPPVSRFLPSPVASPPHRKALRAGNPSTYLLLPRVLFFFFSLSRCIAFPHPPRFPLHFGAAPDLARAPPSSSSSSPLPARHRLSCFGALRNRPIRPAHASLSFFGTVSRRPRHRHRHRHQPWRRSCDRRRSVPAAPASAAGRARPSASTRTAGRRARTAQRACTSATCPPSR